MSDMIGKTSLGKSGLQVSKLAFGADLIGSKYGQAQSFSLLDHYWEHGGNFVDTANFYASWYPGCVGGESETAIGAWMKERRNRDQMVISTKVAFDYPGSPGGLNRLEIEQECEKSLRRLDTDRVDLYYSHRDDMATPLEETMEAYDRLVRAGKVRAIGASNLTLWRIAEANAVSRFHSWTAYSVIEQRFTYLRARHGALFGPQLIISEEMKQFSTAHGVALIGYSVLLQGAYSRRDKEIPSQFAGVDSDERLIVLRAISEETGCTPNQVVIAWIRQTPPGILPIVGASSKDQLDESIGAEALTLTEEHMERLTTAGNAEIKRAWLQPT
jgi:aryl-alcohol dehydrogenase-like predicted oxidoreductase